VFAFLTLAAVAGLYGSNLVAYRHALPIETLRALARFLEKKGGLPDDTNGAEKEETKAEFPASATGNSIEFVFAEPRTVRSVVCRNTAPHSYSSISKSPS
jgi:hypothetical protein